MPRKSWSRVTAAGTVELRPIGPPLRCTECGGIFQEIEEDEDKVLVCAWCFGGGPFDELDYDNERFGFPTVGYERIVELQAKNKPNTVFYYRKRAGC